MIVRNSRRVPPCSARESRASASSIGDARDKLTHAIGRHGPVGSEAEDKIAHDLADEPRPLVIPATFGGIRGAIVARFIDFRPFHGGRNGD